MNDFPWYNFFYVKVLTHRHIHTQLLRKRKKSFSQKRFFQAHQSTSLVEPSSGICSILCFAHSSEITLYLYKIINSTFENIIFIIFVWSRKNEWPKKHSLQKIYIFFQNNYAKIDFSTWCRKIRVKILVFSLTGD